MTSMVETRLNAHTTDVIEAFAPPAKTRVAAGVAVAAILAAMIGLLTHAGVNQFTAISKDFNVWVHDVGKLWMPGAQGIGPYSGKETLSALAWILSWVGLHFALRGRELNLSRWLLVFLVGVGIATTWIWPPVFEYFAGH
jgi:hypothetical protein